MYSTLLIVSCETEKDQRRIAEMTAVAYSRNTDSEDGGQGV